jgi:hypothetical protein
LRRISTRVDGLRTSVLAPAFWNEVKYAPKKALVKQGERTSRDYATTAVDARQRCAPIHGTNREGAPKGALSAGWEVS